MAEHKSESLKFLYNGMALGVANDLPLKGKYNFGQNVRIVTEGVIESRPMLDNFIVLNPDEGLVPHSLETIINKSNFGMLRIAGVGTKLFTGVDTPLAIKDTGYSGLPLFIVDFRPENAIEAYAYIADGNKFKKISVSNTLSDVGITPPAKAATWRIGTPNRKIIDKIDTGSAAQWLSSAGATSDQTRVNTTITSYLADGALPNFASIVPAAMTASLQADSIVTLNASEDVIVTKIVPAALNAAVATIAKISYDTGTTGACTIVLDISSKDIIRDSILYLNASEYVRVTDVTYDGNGVPSIRTVTVGTFVIGNTVSGVASFRFYATVGYAAGNTITSGSIKSVLGTGISTLTRTFNVDLTNANGKPLGPNDIFHISLLPSDPTKLIEIQIQLDVNSGANKYTEQYFLYPISPNFFSGAVAQTTPTISAIQQVAQRRELIDSTRNTRQRLYEQNPEGIDLPDPFASDEQILTDLGIINDSSNFETELGQNQWTEVSVRLSDFVRVGSDDSRTFKDIDGIRISINTSAAIDFYIDSLWVGGADALETESPGFLPYNYVWRIRDPATKVSSNWSPPLRTGIKVSRGKVVLNFLDANTLYPVTYKIDIARFGGSLNDFRIVGSIFNDGSEYTDTSSDRLIADNDLAGRFAGQGSLDAVFDFYKPFAILDTPKIGTCDVIGTKFIWKTLDKLNITYPRGTQIIINGIANSFYTNPSDDQHVELEMDMGNLAGVKFELQAPLLTGQTLPVIFGPTGKGNAGLTIFGIGDKNAAGTLYWLDGNNPDTQSDLNRLEISSPSEPLVSGVIYDDYAFVWSTARSWMIIPTNVNGRSSFIARENANSRGLFSKWAICVGHTHIYFLSENADGIYRVQGNGNPECITNDGFNSLFYINGKAPSSIKLVDGTVIYPPDFTKVDDNRLFSINDYIIYRFKDTDPSGSKAVTLVFSIKTDSFVSYDTFLGGLVNMFYAEDLENSTTVFVPPDVLKAEYGTRVLVGTAGAIKIFGTAGTWENSLALESKIIPFAFDGGNSRLLKLFDEEMLSIDAGTTGVSIRNYFDNGKSFDGGFLISGSLTHIRDSYINLINNGLGTNAKNITTVFNWLLNANAKLYEELFYYIPQADEITDRAGDTEFGENIGEKLWQGIIIQLDTFGENKVLQFYDDENIIRATITINCNGKQTIAKSFDQPFISHTIRRTSSDNVNWISYEEAYVNDPEPESAKVWEDEFDTGNLTGLIFIKRMAWAYRSTANSILILTFEDGTEQTYDLPNSSGLYNKEFFYAYEKKWKACKWRVETDGEIRLYKKHVEVWMKSINSAQPFALQQPLGGLSNVTGAFI